MISRSVANRLLLVSALVALPGCGKATAPAPKTDSPPAPAAVPVEPAKATPIHAGAAPEKIASRNLPNAFRLHANVISGGLPEGDAAFEELEKLGVKTVISVDGAQPDVALAKKHGMRYVHLPHGYDGIPPERALELAKAVRDLPGPIYVHCHHGQHRSPAAAAVACVLIGYLQPEQGMEVLKAAGTNPNYRGLFQAVEAARPLEAKTLDDVPDNFPEVSKIPPLAEAMVAIDDTHERLKSLAKSAWQPPADHADLDAAHEALLLKEHFTELARTDDAQRQPARFGELLADAKKSAADLEAALREPDKAADAAFARVGKNCTACHVAYRDPPRH